MTQPLLLLWHRRDLRLADHLALHRAVAKSDKIVGLFCLDPHICQAPDISPARMAYLWDCLKELEEQYLGLGSQLLIFRGAPLEVIPKVAQGLAARAVFWTLDVEPYAQKRDQQVAIALRALKIGVETCWDQLLHAPGEILTKGGEPYTVYTPFWKNWSQKDKAAVVPAPSRLQGLNPQETQRLSSLQPLTLPPLETLGFTCSQTLPLKGGSLAAQARLTWFMQEALGQYQENRNFPALDGTSQLSAPLKFGAIGIRTLWQASITAANHSRSEEEEASIRTWQQELAWREFYQHCLYFFPNLAAGPYRDKFRYFPWENNPEHFQAWCAGKTGYPIVDAAMRQLQQTGWMHNRCRMIVASFLSKDLILNWQEGELYFMQNLYDGDLAANNGGWQWSTSSGMDPKPLRIFNPLSQAQKFDAEGDYIRRWLPELASLATEDILSGRLGPAERRALGYPLPIVDHQRQQQEFKRRYQGLP